MANKERLVSVPAARAHVEAAVADPILKACINNVLDDLPAVDTVEVIRCKDCTHFPKGVVVAFCRRAANGPAVMSDDFCSNGESRCDNG